VTLDREASQQRWQRLFRLLCESKRGATAAPKGQK